MRILLSALAYFALSFAAGFALGAVRVTLLVPRLGMRTAELLEMPVMLVVIVWAARFIVRRFALPAARLPRLATGAIALALLLAAELVLAVLIQDQTLGEYLAGRDPVSGGVYLAMLCLFALLPALVTPAPPD